MCPRRLALLCSTGIAAFVLGLPSARADVAGPDIVSFLNAQRSAHGIPAGIVEDASLSEGCAKHDRYEQANHLAYPQHFEDASSPGYTTEGDQAAKTSVLYGPGGEPWSATRDPFETAPIHLHQLLAPRLDRMGAAEITGWGCATTHASTNRPPPPAHVTYTYPGNGSTSWPPAQTAAEGPYTPGQRVGIPANTETGPYLYVTFDGPDLTPFDVASATSATLTGPSGPVDVATVDNRTPGLEGYLPTGMEVIPRAPLEPATSYTATVSANVTTQGGVGPARSFSHTWSFTTGPRANAVHINGETVSGRTVALVATSTAPAATAVATGPGTPASAPLGPDGTTALQLDADGNWQVCVRSGGVTTGYAAAQDCIAVTVSQPDLTRAPGTAHFRRLRVAVPRSVRHGRRIPIAITTPRPLAVRLTLRTGGGRKLIANPYQSLPAGQTSTYHLRVPKRYGRKGARVRLTLVFRGAHHPATIQRTIRFR